MAGEDGGQPLNLHPGAGQGELTLPRRQRNRRDKGRVVQTLATRKALAGGSAGSLQELLLQTPAGLLSAGRGRKRLSGSQSPRVC